MKASNSQQTPSIHISVTGSLPGSSASEPRSPANLTPSLQQDSRRMSQVSKCTSVTTSQRFGDALKKIVQSDAEKQKATMQALGIEHHGQVHGNHAREWKSSFGYTDPEKITLTRQKVFYALHSDTAHLLVGIAIVLSFVIVVVQTDASAEDTKVPKWVTICDYILLNFYILELVSRIYVSRVRFFKNVFNMIDMSVVFIDITLEASNLISGQTALASAGFLRVARLARLTRAYRVLMMLPMLSGMVKDLVGAMYAVFWGFFFLSAALTVSSIIAVQLLHPLVKDLADNGVYDGCPRCHRAFSSVMQSNLTFLQQIIAGDSWGQVSVPLIEAHPLTACFFVPVLIFVNLGIMNVILAVIVESAEDARKNDVMTRAKAKETEFVQKSKHFLNLCKGIDLDGSGDISLMELMEGMEENEELAITMHDMGIAREDIKTIFEIMDEDRSGKVDYKEFVQHIHKMRTADEQTVMNFIKHYVMQILRRVNGMYMHLTPDQIRPTLSGLNLEKDNSGIAGDNSRMSFQGCTSIPTALDELRSDVEMLRTTFLSPTHNIDDRNLAEPSDGSKAYDPVSRMPVGSDVVAIRELCDKILHRVDVDFSQAIEKISQQCQEQLSMLGAISKAQSETCLQRRSMEGVLRGAADRSDAFTPPLDAGVPVNNYGRPVDRCSLVFQQCSIERAAKPSSPRHLQRRHVPTSPRYPQ